MAALQTDIKTFGFGDDLQVDGALGQKSKAAVESFRRSAKLGRTGIVDRATRDAIALWLKHG